MTTLDDQILGRLLLEFDALGEDIQSANRLQAAQDETMRELSADPRTALPIAEHQRHQTVRDEAGDLAADSLNEAARRRESSRKRRHEILLCLAGGLPFERWIASGEWALYVSSSIDEPGSTHVHRALSRAVAQAYEDSRRNGPAPSQVVALSRAMEFDLRENREAGKKRLPASLLSAVLLIVPLILAAALTVGGLLALLAIPYVLVADPLHLDPFDAGLLTSFLLVGSAACFQVGAVLGVRALSHGSGRLSSTRSADDPHLADPADGPPLLSRVHQAPSDQHDQSTA